MKAKADWRKNSNGRFTRTTALLLISALLCPLLLLKPTQSISAKSALQVIQTPAAPASAPPEPFVLSSTNNTISTAAISSVTSFGSFVSSAYSSATSLFTAPQIPAEFAGAKAVSPFSGFLSSTSSSITSSVSSLGSFFGFVKPAAPAAAAAMLMSQPRANVQFDFDGDHKADIGSFHRATAEWKVRLSSNNSNAAVNIGSTSSIIAPGDYDGDGITDAAVFNNGTWTVRKSSTSSTSTVSFGQAGDKPAVGDYDGDGKSDYAIFRPSTSTWWFNKSTDNTVNSYQFGAAGDIPVVGDYDGDLKSDFAVYRPSVGYWYVMGSTAGFSSLQWGNATDIPVPADYDGDGKTDRAVYRGSTGQWFIFKSSDNSYIAPSWGNYGDQPVPADYDGDGKADIAVFRPTNTVWYITRSGSSGFDAWNLGVPDDTPVEAAYLRQIGGEVYNYDFARTRLSPKNAMGGTNLYSRNFGWGTGLVGLSGRAGMDAGFGISYNSLIWTKQGSAMVFDADKSNVAPGFRFGYPTIEPVYYDATTQKFNYLMITPSGAKVEFRQQQGASNVYETADSSYTQLKINGTGNPNDAAEDLPITVTTTDGTQMSYSYISGAYRCTQIKDANGNYITIFNDEYGLLRSVTDTLGRVININYDANLNLTSISQTWKDNNGQGSDVTHTYATFTYANQAINTNFSTNINTIYGPQGVTTRVLQSIAFADGASTKFDYNSYGQVYKVGNYASDNHELNHTQVNLSDSDLTSAQTDCPRFSQTKNYAENFNNNQETVTTNSYQENQTLSGTNEPVTLVSVTTPDGVVEHSYSLGRTDWTEGLPYYSETCTSAACTGADKKRWVLTTWAQDNQTAPYLLNPRQTSVTVSDYVSSRKTEIEYYTQQNSTAALYGLVKEVRSYDVYNNNALLKKATTEYNLDNAYTSRRILGLPSKTESFGLNQANNQFEQTSKVTYAYDEGDFTDTTLNQNLSSAIQHDNTNYGASFVSGRGNLTSMTRWDVAGQMSSVTSSVKYNTTGAPVAQTTPGSDSANPTRTVKIGYTDSFNDNTNRNAFAYPTTLTDPAGLSSNVKYRFDIGANVWAKSPAPQNQTDGKTSERVFDSIGRLQKQSILNNGGAYTRYEYPASGNYSKVFSTVTDTNNNGAADAADEVLAESYFDGAGRIRQSRTELPGSAGGWSGQKTEYYTTGQVKRQSIPTEINSNWNPAGDDLARGWLWTSNEYDWKGRATRTINTDGTDKVISYDGCGCAGGQVTTVQGENIVESDWQNNNQTTLGRRTQKIYADVQGRTVKTEVMNWDGVTPYTTTVNAYNGRDQVTSSIQYAGAASVNSPHQDVTMEYDGHGRIKTQHRPEQNANTATTYNYNADDSIQSVVDARGASVNYTYNSRGLVGQISSTVPTGSTIPVAPTVAFAYDNIGNRTSMTDGLGSVAYEYNQLSQMTSETRQFSDTLANAPLANNSFRLEYDYTFSGQLKSLKDPYGQQFNYAYDKVGRLNSVAGATAFAGITNYASNPGYNARGTLTALHYGNGVEMAITGFNNKLQATDFEIKKGATSIIKKQYQFYNDGSLKFSKDLNDAKYDRSYKYDHLGRTVEGRSGAEARGQTDTAGNIPYRTSYGYNAFGNITETSAVNYSSLPQTTSNTFTNSRNPNWSYDADGNTISDEQAVYQVDAAGRMFSTTERDPNDSSQMLPPTLLSFDGTGQNVKRIRNYLAGNPGNNQMQTSYFINSSVLGKTVSETNGTGAKVKTYVHANGTLVAEQQMAWNGYNQEEWVLFNHRDASGASLQKTRENGALESVSNGYRSAEFDPLGQDVGWYDRYLVINDTPPDNEFGAGGSLLPTERWSTMSNGRLTTFAIDGLPVSMDFFQISLEAAFPGGVQFGLLEMSARMSAQPPREIGHWRRTVSWNETWGEDTSETSVTTHTTTQSFSYRTGTVYADNNWWRVGNLISAFSFNERPLAQTQQKQPLSDDQNKKVAKQVDGLKEKLNKIKKDCQTKVIDKLNTIKGFSLDKFKAYLDKGVSIYDGTASTIELNNAVDSSQLSNAAPNGYTVAKLFTDKPGLNALTSGSLSIDALTIFWRPDAVNGFSKARIFHEALHGFGASLNSGKLGDFGDTQIQNLFGITVDTNNTGNITDYIDKYCIH